MGIFIKIFFLINQKLWFIIFIIFIIVKYRQVFNIFKSYNSILSGNLENKLTSDRRKRRFNEGFDWVLLHHVPNLTSSFYIGIRLEKIKLMLSFIVTKIINCRICEGDQTFWNTWIYMGPACSSHSNCNSTCKVKLGIDKLFFRA
jgi:hypothetical protein